MINLIQEKYNAHAVFPYGSSVYGNKKPDDYDFIVVSDQPYFQEQYEIDGVKIEISNYSKDDFMERLNQHDISALECIYINHKDKFITDDFRNTLNTFVLNKEKMRDGCSQKSSNSYVKAKKKLIVEEDFNMTVSLKSLWHSIRILDFGLQIAQQGKINPTSCNDRYDEILKDYLVFNNDWTKLHEKYRPIYNAMASEFKLACPKAIVSKSQKYN